MQCSMGNYNSQINSREASHVPSATHWLQRPFSHIRPINEH